MFDHNYCIVILSLENFGKSLRKFIFCITIMVQKQKAFIGFENPCSRPTTYIILTSLDYVHFYASYCWWHQILVRAIMRICKVQKLCINSMWIAWLIHGFWPVETWILIACDTAFYAIICYWYLFFSTEPLDEIMTLVIVHYTYFLYLVFTSKPENNVVIGLHEPAGPCDELQPVTTPFGHVSIADFWGLNFKI